MPHSPTRVCPVPIIDCPDRRSRSRLSIACPSTSIACSNRLHRRGRFRREDTSAPLGRIMFAGHILHFCRRPRPVEDDVGRPRRWTQRRRGARPPTSEAPSLCMRLLDLQLCLRETWDGAAVAGRGRIGLPRCSAPKSEPEREPRPEPAGTNQLPIFWRCPDHRQRRTRDHGPI